MGRLTDPEERAAAFVAAARSYAGLGWVLLDLDGKEPCKRRWQKTTYDPPELAAGKWSDWGRSKNVGVLLGASRLAVVEPDTPEAYAKLLELLGGELPPVPIVKSGGKSLHLYFVDGGQGNASRDGLELRAGNQQCVLPPSVHPETGRPYGWLEGHEPTLEPIAIPQAVLGYFGADEARKKVAPVGDAIATGERHRTLISLAGSMRHRGMSGDEIAVALLAVNRRRCKPPLPDDEIAAMAHDVARRYQPPPPDLEQERLEREAEKLLDRLAAGEDAKDGGGHASSRAKTSKRKRPMQRRPLRRVPAEIVEFAIGKTVPRSAPTLLAGVGGLGKSALLLAWAKQVTDTGGNVLIVSYEDGAAAVLRPRFEALGGDLDRLYELYVDVLDGSVSFPADLGELDRHVKETQARVLLIDPVSASIDVKLDAHKDQDVRVVLGQLAHLAERERLAVIMNAHLNKAPSVDPYLRINGSTAFYNAARSVLTVTPDPVDPDWQRLVAHHKSNYGPLAPVERWRVKPATIVSPAGLIETMTLEFVEIADDVSREDVLASRPGTEAELEKATQFLRGALIDGGWHDSAGLKALAGAQRISERTLKRAAQELEVEHERRGFPATTWWRLQSGQPFPHESGPTGETA